MPSGGPAALPRLAVRQLPGPPPLAGDLANLVAAIPLEYLQTRRWFAGKGRAVKGLALFDYGLLADQPLVVMALIRVDFHAGEPEVYSLPLLVARPGAGAGLPADATPFLWLDAPEGGWGVWDALLAPAFGSLLLRRLTEGASLPTAHGAITFEATERLARAAPAPPPALLRGEQSNTSLRFGDSWIFKLYRRLGWGISRDLEIAAFFGRWTDFRDTPLLGGSVGYHRMDGHVATLGLLQDFLPNQGDGWSYVLRQLSATLGALASDPAEARLREMAGGLLDELEQLGEVTGRMHLALGSRPDVPDFAPRPILPRDVAAWREDLLDQARRALAGLRPWLAWAAPAERARAARLLAREPELLALLDHLVDRIDPAGLRQIQIHGDYHLGQVLKTSSGWAVIDFEGEPARPLEQRRAKQPALRDVAGMLRSFGYAAHAAQREPGAAAPTSASLWERLARAAYLRGYRRATAASDLIPAAADTFGRLVRLFEAAKALYELNYELNTRPDWVAIPLEAVERLLLSEREQSERRGEGGRDATST